MRTHKPCDGLARSKPYAGRYLDACRYVCALRHVEQVAHLQQRHTMCDFIPCGTAIATCPCCLTYTYNLESFKLIMQKHGQDWRTSENTSGKVPPTLMPVMMRSISSCQ